MSAKHASKTSTNTASTDASKDLPKGSPETAAAHDAAVRNAQKKVLAAATSGTGLPEAQKELQDAVAARTAFATKRLPLACKHFLDLPTDATDAAKAEAMKELRSALSALATVATPPASTTGTKTE